MGIFKKFDEHMWKVCVADPKMRMIFIIYQLGSLGCSCLIYSFVVFQHYTIFLNTTLFDCATHIVMLSSCVAPYFSTQLARLTKCWWFASSAIGRPLLVVIRVPFPNLELILHLRCNYDWTLKIEGCTSFSWFSCQKHGTLGHGRNVSL